MTIIEAFHVGKGKVRTKKRYRWYIPENLEGKIKEGDIAWVDTNVGIGPVLVVKVLEEESNENYQPVIKVERKEKKAEPKQEQAKKSKKNKKWKYRKKVKKDIQPIEDKSEENVIETHVDKSIIEIQEENVIEVKKRGKFSEVEKAEIKAKRADGKKLKDLAEMYSCSISLIHRIIKEQ